MIFTKTCVKLLKNNNFEYFYLALELVQSTLNKDIYLNTSTSLLKLMCLHYPSEMSQFLETLKSIYDSLENKSEESLKNIITGIIFLKIFLYFKGITILLTKIDHQKAEQAFIYFCSDFVKKFNSVSTTDLYLKYLNNFYLFFKSSSKIHLNTVKPRYFAKNEFEIFFLSGKP